MATRKQAAKAAAQLPPVLPSSDKIATAVVDSKNEKTGVMAATYVSQASCPNGENSSYKCPLLGAGCYAEGGTTVYTTSRLNRAADFSPKAPSAEVPPDVAAQAEAVALEKIYPKWLKTEWWPSNRPGVGPKLHQPLRLHVVGDCVTAKSASIVAKAANQFSQTLSNNGNSAYGYTHGWRDYARSAWGRISVLASCDTMSDIVSAFNKGWAPAAVVQRYALSNVKNNFGGAVTLTNGYTLLPCPFEAERQLQAYQQKQKVSPEIKKHWDLTGMPPVDKPIEVEVVKDGKTKIKIITQDDWIREKRLKDVQCVNCQLCMRDEFLQKRKTFIAFAAHQMSKENQKKLINIEPYLPKEREDLMMVENPRLPKFDWSLRDTDVNGYADVLDRWFAWKAEIKSARRRNPSIFSKAKSYLRGKTQAMRRLKAQDSPLTKDKKIAARIEGYAMQPKGAKRNPQYAAVPIKPSQIRQLVRDYPRMDVAMLWDEYVNPLIRSGAVEWDDPNGISPPIPPVFATLVFSERRNMGVRGYDKLEDFLKGLDPKAKAIMRYHARKSNPHQEASEMYRKFHGRPSKSILEIPEREHVHKHLAQLGTLTEIKVRLKPLGPAKDQRLVTLGAGDAQAHEDSKAIHLCTSEDATSLYFVGGDQKLDLNALGFSKDDIKDLMLIGEVVEITYRTQKNFDKFKTLDYFHGLSEVTKRNRPVLLYKPRDRKMLMAGGEYRVKPEGIVN